MKIVLSTGASGGHLYPAIELGEELRKRGHDVLFIGTLGHHVHALQERGFSYEVLLTKGLIAGALWRRLSGLGLMAKAFGRSCRLLSRYRPQIVVGFGGHGSFAVVLAASWKNIPTMIHEQNVVPGRANRYLAKIVRKIAISFASTRRYFNAQKTVLTGCPTPLRPTTKRREDILKAWGLSDRKRTIMVFGGSQGAHRINEIYVETVKDLGKKSDFQTIHITGKNDVEVVKKAYSKVGHPAAVFAYLKTMAEAYEASDLVICRAGAMTVTELALFRKRAILIPYPHAQGHQLHNAEALAQSASARVIEEKDLSVRSLAECLIKCIDETKKNQEEGQEHSIFFKDSSQRLADAALSLI